MHCPAVIFLIKTANAGLSLALVIHSITLILMRIVMVIMRRLLMKMTRMMIRAKLLELPKDLLHQTGKDDD